MACVPSYADGIGRREQGRGGEGAFCLRNNHFHLLVETPQANLSTAMRQLNGSIPKLSTAVTTGWVIFCPATSRRSPSRRRWAAAEGKGRAFVAEGIGQGAPWEQVGGQGPLGSDRFVEGLRSHRFDHHSYRECCDRRAYTEQDLPLNSVT